MVQLLDDQATSAGASRVRRAHAAGREWVDFDSPPGDHHPPSLLGDEDLAVTIATLRAKLRSTYAGLAMAHLRGGLLSMATLLSAAFLLWLGPATLVDAFVGRGIATVWDVVFWWVLLASTTALMGGYSTFALARSLREVRGWRHRVRHLTDKLTAARREQLRRADP